MGILYLLFILVLFTDSYFVQFLNVKTEFWLCLLLNLFWKSLHIVVLLNYTELLFRMNEDIMFVHISLNLTCCFMKPCISYIMLNKY